MKNNTGTPVEVKNTLIATKTGKKVGVHEEYHLNGCTFRCVGRKWQFSATGKAGNTATLLVAVRGGAKNAERVAGLFAGDINKHGRFGASRSNVNRLVAANSLI